MKVLVTVLVTVPVKVRMHLSPGTVTTWRLLEKMGMKSNAELTRYTLEHGARV